MTINCEQIIERINKVEELIVGFANKAYHSPKHAFQISNSPQFHIQFNVVKLLRMASYSHSCVTRTDYDHFRHFNLIFFDIFEIRDRGNFNEQRS